MEDEDFIDQMKAKIENLTRSEIKLYLDSIDNNQIKVKLDGQIPEVTVGSNVLQYSGFARMGIEYAVASIREGRELGPLEFHVLLARN